MNQCSSCGGFCKKSGCERALVDHPAPPPAGERADLIEALKRTNLYYAHGKAIGLAKRAIDMLEADAQQVAVPHGWALVPIEPTEEMIAAGRAAPCTTDEEDMDDDYRSVYKAMLAAAQGAKP